MDTWWPRAPPPGKGLLITEPSGPLAVVQGASAELPAGPGSHVAHFTLRTLPNARACCCPALFPVTVQAFVTWLELATLKHATAGNSKGARQVSFWCLIWLLVVRGPVPTEGWGLPSPLPQFWRVIIFSPIPRGDVREPLLPACLQMAVPESRPVQTDTKDIRQH